MPGHTQVKMEKEGAVEPLSLHSGNAGGFQPLAKLAGGESHKEELLTSMIARTQLSLQLLTCKVHIVNETKESLEVNREYN